MSEQTSTPASSGHGGGHDDHGVGHVAPLKMLYGVLAALLFLTWFTVFTAGFDLGFLNIWVAMGIASVKASLVVLFFMHLIWDKPFNQVLFVATLVFLGLFIALCLIDTRAYLHQIDQGDSIVVTEQLQPEGQ